MDDSFRDKYFAANRLKNLSECGQQVSVDYDVQPKLYFRSGIELLRMANVYVDENNLENAFILYSKYITLFVEKLPKHPEYKTISVADRQAIKKKLTAIFQLAEAVKKKLKVQYEEEEIIYVEREKKRLKELADLKAKEDLLREQKAKEEEEKSKQRESSLSSEIIDEQKALYLAIQEEERRRLEALKISQNTTDKDLNEPKLSFNPMATVVSEHNHNISNTSQNNTHISDPSFNSHSSIASAPAIDRSTKPSLNHLTSAWNQTSTNEYGLRDVIVPSDVSLKFKNLAHSNSIRDVETLGLLCGKLRNDKFHITHLIIPRQNGTSDSCDMIGEEEIYEVQDKYDLLTLGWIHTHPSQTAFLSSVDMHQHWPYQKLMPEAIAIVCSIKFQETGYFFLTPNYGLDIIGNCPKRGFHEHHKNPPLFETCPHIKDDPSSIIKIIDLRR